MATITRSRNSKFQTTSLANTKFVSSSPRHACMMMYSMAPTNESPSSDIQTTTDMPSPTSYQAAHAVLFTNELLCGIVAHLPLNDIVATTGICRFWREALKSDPNIQEALFLKPAEIREVMAPNYLIRNSTDSIRIDACSIIGALHPSLRRICGSICSIGDAVYPPKLPNTFPKFEYPDGTWREMLITQPPSKCFKVAIKSRHSRSDFLEDLKNDTGVKIGELYDSIHANIAGGPQEKKRPGVRQCRRSPR